MIYGNEPLKEPSKEMEDSFVNKLNSLMMDYTNFLGKYQEVNKQRFTISGLYPAYTRFGVMSYWVNIFVGMQRLFSYPGNNNLMACVFNSKEADIRSDFNAIRNNVSTIYSAYLSLILYYLTRDANHVVKEESKQMHNNQKRDFTKDKAAISAMETHVVAARNYFNKETVEMLEHITALAKHSVEVSEIINNALTIPVDSTTPATIIPNLPTISMEEVGSNKPEDKGSTDSNSKLSVIFRKSNEVVDKHTLWGGIYASCSKTNPDILTASKCMVGLKTSIDSGNVIYNELPNLEFLNCLYNPELDNTPKWRWPYLVFQDNTMVFCGSRYEFESKYTLIIDKDANAN